MKQVCDIIDVAQDAAVAASTLYVPVVPFYGQVACRLGRSD
jgi:hypothetical protein